MDIRLNFQKIHYKTDIFNTQNQTCIFLKFLLNIIYVVNSVGDIVTYDFKPTFWGIKNDFKWS